MIGRANLPGLGWTFGMLDRQQAGDFNGDGMDDLFLSNGGRAGLLLATGEGFHCEWVSGTDAGPISVGQWPLALGDLWSVGDFTGDGRSDLFVHNGDRAALLASNGFALHCIWTTTGPAAGGVIGPWQLAAGDSASVGDFDGDGLADILMRNGSSAGLLLSTGQGFYGAWKSSTLGNWMMGSADRLLVGDFDANGLNDLFIRNDTQATLLTSDGGNFVSQWTAMLGDLQLEGPFEQVAGRFNY